MTDFSSQEGLSEINYSREGVKIGLICGGIALLLWYGSYFIGFNTFYRIFYFSSFIPYMLTLILIHGLNLRKKDGGYLSFKNALKYAFTAYIVAEIIIALGTYILFNVVNPELTRMIAMETTIRFPDQIKTLKLTPEQYIAQNSETTLKNIILGLGTSLVIKFVLSLLLSLIIRREKPVF